MIVSALREQVGVRVLGKVGVFDSVILKRNHVNYTRFVASHLNKNNGDDAWYASAVIHLNVRSRDV